MDVERAHGFHHAGGQAVAAQDAAENVDQHCAHVGVAEDDLESLAHLLGAGAAAHVEKVGGLAARQLDDVHGGHGQPGAVHHAADVAAELDIVQTMLGGFNFERLFLVQVAQLVQVGVAEEGVVVEVELGVERH